MMGIYLTVVGQNNRSPEAEGAPFATVSFTSESPETELTLPTFESASFAENCRRIAHPENWTLPAGGLEKAWHDVIVGISQLGAEAIKDEYNSNRYIPPIEVATALTAAVLTQVPSPKDEEMIITFAKDFGIHDLEFGSLLAFRFLAVLRLIQEQNPVMFDSITAYYEADARSKYQGHHNILELQGRYIDDVSKIITFMFLQQFELVETTEIAQFEETGILTVMKSELAQFDRDIYPTQDISKMWDDFTAVLDTKDYREWFLGSQMRDGDDRPNAGVIRLISFLKESILLKLVQFDNRKSKAAIKYLNQREKLFTTGIFAGSSNKRSKR